ncbi:MAG: tyrosine--tRNA ligase [Lachnospiraceae bacterium]|jgi:tyrosyl-tRNA synthetase|nr:tyrosine--tRNA ligase [Lachnospiraceae bacterium]
MQIFDELKERGQIAQMTDEDEIRDLINNGKATFYIGFDPTADSLHIGHYVTLCLMKRLQQAGNRPIALVGGGTGMVGDPSHRTELRSVLTEATIDDYCASIRRQMEKFLDFGDDKGIFVNNAEWLRELKYVDILRDVGSHFSVNRMLQAECYKQRMEKGLSFLEFNYMIMQSYDYFTLYQRYGCNLQLGGDDQWSNLLAGTDLIRRKLGKNVYAMTIQLLLNTNGVKMGKTEKGALWLSPDRTSPFDFYQYFRNVADADVINYLKILTFLPLSEIKEMEKWEGSQLNEAKEILATQMTTMIHGSEEAEKARQGAKTLFTGGSDNIDEVPATVLADEDFCNGEIDIITLLVSGGLVNTRSEGRRVIEQGGVIAAESKVTDTKQLFKREDFAAEGILIRRGKKNFRMFRL